MAADGDQHLVGGEAGFGAFGVAHAHRAVVALAEHAVAQVQFDAELAQGVGHRAGQLLVIGRQDA
ncbi:hypothetical protein D3C76_1670860 [compost metagenome]